MGIMASTEKLLINNALREWFRRRYEVPILLEQLALPKEASILEVGCGRGGLTLLLARRFRDAHITAIDYDLKMIVRARIFLEAKPRWAADVIVDHIRLQRGDATNLPFADRTFDAAFACLVLHHIPDWEKAVQEIGRVLKPGALLVCEELFGRFFRAWAPLARLFPPEAMIAEEAFSQRLKQTGFEVVRYQRVLWGAGCVATARKDKAGACSPGAP